MKPRPLEPAAPPAAAHIFADSRVALDFGFPGGPPAGTLVRTTSPGLLADGGLDARAADAGLGAAELRRMGIEVGRMAARIGADLAADAELADLALLVERQLLHLQHVVAKAMGLGPADFAAPATVLRLETGEPALDARLNGPWQELLASNPGLDVVRVPRTALPRIEPAVPGTPGLATRLRFEDWQSIGYRLAERLWRRLPAAAGRGTVLVLSEGSLLKECAFHMALAGYALRRLTLPRTGAAEVGEEMAAGLDRHLAGPLKQTLESLLCPAAVAPALDCLRRRIVAACARARASVAYWERRIDAAGRAGPAFLFSADTFAPEAEALFALARRRGLPIVMFQHGVSVEINARMDLLAANFETTEADVFFCFNRRAQAVYGTNPRARGRAVAVGLSADYLRAGRYRRPRAGTAPIVYVSTQVYVGNIQIAGVAGVTDAEKARGEAALVREVLARLPHRVLWKPYLSLRYLDPDPVLTAAREADNIEVYEGDIDLRYLLPDCRVIVTSRATSTVSWCLMSGRPVVFIDLPDQYPLRLDARRAFAAGLFLFDGGAADLHARLRAFLSQPIEAIEAEWRTRGQARREMLDAFVASAGAGAGRRAARHLLGRGSGGAHLHPEHA